MTMKLALFFWSDLSLIANFVVALQCQLESIPVLVQGVWSADTAAQLEATTQFRKLLSIGKGVVEITKNCSFLFYIHCGSILIWIYEQSVVPQLMK